MNNISNIEKDLYFSWYITKWTGLMMRCDSLERKVVILRGIQLR